MQVIEMNGSAWKRQDVKECERTREGKRNEINKGKK